MTRRWQPQAAVPVPHAQQRIPRPAPTMPHAQQRIRHPAPPVQPAQEPLAVRVGRRTPGLQSLIPRPSVQVPVEVMGESATDDARVSLYVYYTGLHTYVGQVLRESHQGLEVSVVDPLVQVPALRPQFDALRFETARWAGLLAHTTLVSRPYNGGQRLETLLQAGSINALMGSIRPTVYGAAGNPCFDLNDVAHVSMEYPVELGQQMRGVWAMLYPTTVPRYWWPTLLAPEV